MANAFRTWRAETEQALVRRAHSFLVNVVGWYLHSIVEDSDSDVNYHWVSEGENTSPPGRRYLGLRGNVNNLTGWGYITDVGEDSPSDWSAGATTPGSMRGIANKDYVCLTWQPASNQRYMLYTGLFDSFYSVVDDPSPWVTDTQRSTDADFSAHGTVYAMREDGDEAEYDYFIDTACINEGYPNPRNGQFSFFRPLLYYPDLAGQNEIRGRLRGVYYGKADRLAHGSFVQIDGDYYLVHKTNQEEDAMLFGPVNDIGEMPTGAAHLAFPNYPTLEVDYDVRGLVREQTVSGTLALWRFDTGHLDGYAYGSGDTLPVPSTYTDETGYYDFAPQNGMTSVESRLREAADFDGSGDYATCAGSATVSGSLNGDWTVECVFMPGSIPTGTDVATLLQYGADSEGNESENTLLQINLVAASGTTPDEHSIERGNIDVRWEYSTSGDVRLCTAGDFIQQDRWNYLAITKTTNGSECDLSVYHCSWFDYLVPSLETTFTGIAVSTGGDGSSWYAGVDASLTNYYTGQIDDTRITKRPLTLDEIETSCARAML